MTSGSPHQEPAVVGSRPLRRVLAASFLDESGLKAVLRAARLPLAPGARVVLLHVTPPWSMRSRPVADEDARRALERAAAAGRDAARSAGNEDPDLVPIVAGGWPAEEIVRFAWQERSELIVVGPPAARIDGSTRATISRVVRRADLPLLVARGDPWQEYRSVLCAVDRSVTAVDTIALAARLGTAAARAFTLFHAYHIPFEAWVGSDVPELEHDAVAYVRALAREVADDVAVTGTVVRRGDRCIQIMQAAADVRADLVVLGTHGRSGISRAVRGSVAEWVIANTPFDVAIARPHRATLERR
jgi:nucleotide-binding universal stress UspA family protein